MAGRQGSGTISGFGDAGGPCGAFGVCFFDFGLFVVVLPLEADVVVFFGGVFTDALPLLQNLQKSLFLR